MVLAIAQNKLKHRFDSSTAPTFTATGVIGAPVFFLRDFLHKQINPLVWTPPNRTATVPVSFRDADFWNWTLSTGINRNLGTNTFTNGKGSDAWIGAVGSAMVAGKFHLEGKPHDLTATICLGLQSGGTAGLIFDGNTDIEHALVFGQNGIGLIYERGVGKPNHTFRWIVGDRGLVEVYDGIVRYYKISATGEMTLLRSTRSLLSGAITPTLTIYHNGGQIENVRVWYGLEAKSQIEIFGVIGSELQDWQNAATYDSLAEKTTNKDKTADYTYFTDERNLMTLSLNLAWREEEEYQAFKEFHQYHDLSRPFIFKDEARHKLLLKPHPGLADNEMFCRFVSGFKDNPLGAALYGVSVDIQQAIDPPVLF